MGKPAVIALSTGVIVAGTLIVISEVKEGNLTTTGQYFFQQIANLIGSSGVASLSVLGSTAAAFTYAGARALKLLCCTKERANDDRGYHAIGGPNLL